MILRRIGNKSQIAMKIQQHFPPHKIYIEPFFGAGGMFFNKPKAKYNIVNDIDSDVFNLFQVVSNCKEEFEGAFTIMPIHQDLLEYWKKNKETDPIKKALRFLFLSNFTYLGKQDTMRSNPDNSKVILYEKLNETNKLIFDVQFFNKDFRKFLSCLSLDSEKRILSNDTFIYADSPYIGTVSTYEMKTDWTEQDANDLMDSLTETGCKWAMSEFDHSFILQQAEKRGLNIITIGERQNLKNVRTEILITNYKNPLSLFDMN
jgi:DNA adenine methylase